MISNKDIEDYLNSLIDDILINHDDVYKEANLFDAKEEILLFRKKDDRIIGMMGYNDNLEVDFHSPGKEYIFTLETPSTLVKSKLLEMIM